MKAKQLIGAVVVLGTVVMGTVGAAQASSSSSSATKWAGEVCSAFLTFGNSAESTLNGLKGSGSTEDAANSAKQDIQSAADDLQHSLDDAGKPPTSNAKQAQGAIQDLGNELSKDSDDVQQALTPSPSTPGEIASAFASIGSTVQKAVNQVKSTASTLQGLKGNNQLKKGFQNASSCQQLKSTL
jgi:hypothetical protein